MHSADNGICQHEDGREHTEAFGIEDANSRRRERAGKRNGHRAHYEGRCEIAGDADAEGFGRNFVSRDCLQIFAKCPAHQDGKQEHEERRDGPDNQQKIAVARDTPPEYAWRWNVNTLSAASQRLGLPNKDDADTLENKRDHRKIMTAKPGAGECDQPPCRPSCQYCEQQCGAVWQAEVDHCHRRCIGADRHHRSRGERNAAPEPDEHNQRGADHHGDDGDRNHVFWVALERQSGDHADDDQQRRPKVRQHSGARITHCAAPFPETAPRDATSERRKAG